MSLMLLLLMVVSIIDSSYYGPNNTGCDFYTSWPKCGDICINPYKCWCGNKRMKNRSDISTSSEYCCSDQSCTYKQDKNYEVGTVRYAQFFLQNIKNSGT